MRVRRTDDGLRAPRVVVLAEHRYLSQPQPAGLIEELRRRGCRAVSLEPTSAAFQAGDDGWLAEADVVVARGRSTAVLCMLAWAEGQQIPTINRRHAVGAVHNKAEMAVALAGAGVPTPPTFLGTTERLADAVSADCYPLLLKPTFGDNSLGIRLVADPDRAVAEPWPEAVALAQPYLPSDGRDLKLYCVGERVWAVHKPSSLSVDGAKYAAPVAAPASTSIQVATATPELRELALRCGRLFGLELYGVDCLETLEGPVVLEVNDFPNYTACEGADRHIADLVIDSATGARQ